MRSFEESEAGQLREDKRFQRLVDPVLREEDAAPFAKSRQGLVLLPHRVLQLLRAVRELPGLSHTPVAIVTRDYYVEDAQAQEITALGAELRYKPLWLDELVSLARGLVGPLAAT